MRKKDQVDAVRITFFGAMLYLWNNDKQFRKAALAILESIPKKKEEAAK